MSDVFEEVEENLRAERWGSLFRKWWPIAAAVAGVAVLVVGGIWFFDARKTWTGAEASVAYQRGLDALQAENTAAAEAAFVQAEGAGNPEYRAAALMQRAGLRLNDGDSAGAVALFDQAAEATHDPMTADLAHLKAALVLMDSGSLEDVTARLSPLTQDDRPYRFMAQEALAMARLQHGQTDAARQQLQALNLQLDLPESMRQRVQMALETIESGTASSIPGIIDAAAQAAAQADAEANAQANAATRPGATPGGQTGRSSAPGAQAPASGAPSHP